MGGGYVDLTSHHRFFKLRNRGALKKKCESESHAPQMKTGFRMPSWTKK